MEMIRNVLDRDTLAVHLDDCVSPHIPCLSGSVECQSERSQLRRKWCEANDIDTHWNARKDKHKHRESDCACHAQGVDPKCRKRWESRRERCLRILM